MAKRLVYLMDWIKEKGKRITKKKIAEPANFPHVINPTKEQIEKAKKAVGIREGQALTKEQYSLYKKELKKLLDLNERAPLTEDELIARIKFNQLYEDKILKGAKKAEIPTREEAREFLKLFPEEEKERIKKENPELIKKYKEKVESKEWTIGKAASDIEKAEREIVDMPKAYKEYQEAVKENPNISKTNLIKELAIRGVEVKEIRGVIEHPEEYKKAYEQAEKRKKRRERLEEGDEKSKIGKLRAGKIQELLRKGHPLKKAIEEADKIIELKKEEKQD